MVILSISKVGLYYSYLFSLKIKCQLGTFCDLLKILSILNVIITLVTKLRFTNSFSLFNYFFSKANKIELHDSKQHRGTDYIYLQQIVNITFKGSLLKPGTSAMLIIPLSTSSNSGFFVSLHSSTYFFAFPDILRKQNFPEQMDTS